MMKRFIFLLVQAVFLIAICLPNLACLFTFTPYLASETNLREQLLNKSGLFIDVAKYYACAQIASQNPAEIWNLNAQQTWFKTYLKIPLSSDLYASGKLSPAQYTPQSIVMFMPLAKLPLHQAIIAWELFSVLFLLIPVSFLLHRYSSFSIRQTIIWWLIVLSAAPTTENFCYGQLNGLLSGLTAIFLLNWQNKNVLLSALSLAFSLALKPHQALVMLVMSLAAKKYKLLLLTIFISLLLLMGSALILGPETVLKYPQALFAIEGAIDKYQLPAPITLIVSISGPISILFGREIARIASLPALVLSLSAIYIIWRRAIKAGAKTYPYAYACSVLLFLILGPHEHFYDLLLLSTVWACTIPTINFRQIMAIKKPFLRLWTILFLLFPFITWTIYFSGAGNKDACFGLWHLPVLILLLLISFFNLKEASA